MQELHQNIFLMQYSHLLFSIIHKFEKSFFFLKIFNIFSLFFKVYNKIGLDVFLKYI